MREDSHFKWVYKACESCSQGDYNFSHILPCNQKYMFNVTSSFTNDRKDSLSTKKLNGNDVMTILASTNCVFIPLLAEFLTFENQTYTY